MNSVAKMKITAQLTVFVLLIAHSVKADDDDDFPISDWNNTKRIIGGTEAPNGAYPYQVSLRTSQNNAHMCGGAIIANRWILTAAHCSGFPLAQFIVVAGTNSLRFGGQVRNVERVVNHPEYNPVTVANDIALLYLNQDIRFGPRVQTIGLAQTEPAAGSVARLTGWGFTSNTNQVASPTLQQIDLNVITRPRCRQTWGNLVTNGVVCTFNQIGQGACAGDSGGPLVYNNQLVGVVSGGTRLCASGRPDVFTNVAHYFTWIAGYTGIE